MREYCYGTGCRRAQLLAHFGEQIAPGAGGEGCGSCDNCEAAFEAAKSGLVP
ncbi:hypothetical protein T484DRAFT_1796749 [Baffinella frigidus]|nr:hypothetical protein T484DRAFT_1796749 [Cryptophyta sp. CCMP2293]